MIELIITVAIVAILAAIALPSYQNYVIKSRRATAATCAVEAAQFMERFYTTNMKYHEDTAGAAPVLPQGQCVLDLAGHYTFGLSAVSANAYEIQAVPQGNQAAKDTKCGTLSINQTGTKNVSNTATPVKECW